MNEQSGPQPHLRVGADIGGTFTDLIVIDANSGRYRIGKTLTTPDDPSRAVSTLLQQMLGQEGHRTADLQQLIHGTTLVTNAMIERKGAATALLTTAGFRDLIEIGRETRYDLYDLMLQKPDPLVPRHLRFDVPQRTLADGTSEQELDESYVGDLAAELARKGIQAIAVCFLHSFSNPNDERRARDLISAASPNLRVSLSSEVVPEIGEYERTSTTIANVYVQELVDRYLRKLEQRLQELGFRGAFYLMLSGGGIATVDTAVRFPVRLLESGPAAGALAAADYGLKSGHGELISFDMGGTTAKICVIENGAPRITHDFEVDRVYRFKRGSGLPIRLPVCELIEIGTGGGSLARVDSLGLLKVGPESAGADPGPACYARGGDAPTVTDANLVLGYLDPNYFLGGGMQLDLDAARQAIESKVARHLRLDVEQAAWGIHQVANESMANAARVHALERGKDPRRFPLFAFGGGGPVQAHRLALALGSPQWIAPLGAGVTSTVGFLSAPLAFDFVRSWPTPLDDVDWSTANRIFSEMEREGHELLVQSDVPEAQIQHRREVDMRFVGQGHLIQVHVSSRELGRDAAASLAEEFRQTYLALYERPGPPVDIEVVNWRVVSSGPRPDVQLDHTPANASAPSRSADKGSRRAFFPELDGFVEAPILDRYLLAPGAQFDGPAIVEERESTAVVGPGATCRVDWHYNLIVVPSHRASANDGETP